MRTRHNLAAYEAAGLEWHHVPGARAAEDGAAALEELLPLLRRELRRRGAVAVHGDRCTGLRGRGLRGAPARGPRRRPGGGARAGRRAPG